MLAPGGVFLHNEARPVVGDLTAAVGLPFEQSRHVVIATVRGAQSPLYDSVYLHRKMHPRGFAPRTPLLARSRGPDAPLRSPGSLAALVRYVSRKLREVAGNT